MSSNTTSLGILKSYPMYNLPSLERYSLLLTFELFPAVYQQLENRSLLPKSQTLHFHPQNDLTIQYSSLSRAVELCV